MAIEEAIRTKRKLLVRGGAKRLYFRLSFWSSRHPAATGTIGPLPC
jgi:hypothetical protein